jgi:neutral ceramidase
MLAGAARVAITPPLPVDVLGYVRRPVAPRRVHDPLMATGVLLRDGDATVVIIAADLVNLTPAFAERVRKRVARAVGCRPDEVLLNSSHSHAAPWPGATLKLGGETDDWTDIELGYWESIPDAFASVAVQALVAAEEARVGGGVGHAPGLAVNRRERTADGRTILGWNPEGFIDDSVPTLRVDAIDGRPIATLVGFGCHPVVVGPEVPAIGSDFVGPLREQVEALRGGGVAVFLQGAAGNVLPLEAFFDTTGPEVPFGRRLGLEAAHAVADAEPRAMEVERLPFGSVTPISLYRRRAAAEQPRQALATVRRVVSLPLLEPPSVAELEAELAEREADLAARAAAGEDRVTLNPIRYHASWIRLMIASARQGPLPRAVEGEVWAARLGDCAVVGTPGEVFGEIGAAVRAASPAPVTIFAGYCNGVLGYIATPEEYPHGGYEPAVSHRGYGHPAPFSPDVAGIIRDTSLELLGELFGGGGR